MLVIQQLTSHVLGNPLFLLAVAPAAVVLHVISYFKDLSGLRSYPRPLLAKFTNSWMSWVVSGNRWSTTVENHKRYGSALSIRSPNATLTALILGTFARLSPNHVSTSDPRALSIIHGHGDGCGHRRSCHRREEVPLQLGVRNDISQQRTLT